MLMLPHDQRKKLAREAYSLAVRAVRERPTRSAWARLLRAAKNLHEAMAEATAFGPRRVTES